MNRLETVIGVDIGGTKINFGMVDRTGAILYKISLPTLEGGSTVTDQLLRGIEAVLKAAEHRPERKVRGIGIGSAGQIDFATGRVHFASSLIPGYTGTPIREIVWKHFGLPVFVDNDVNVLALAEKYFGAGQDVGHLLCIALGTGVGGAALIDGRLLHGVNGGAGEIGHLSVDFNGPRCICGNYGCLELYASGTGISNRYAERTGAPQAAAREVVERWRKGEPAAREVMEEAITALAAAVAGLIHTFNPRKVVIGGGIADIGEELFLPLRERVRDRTMPSMHEPVEIVPSVLGSWSGVAGAAAQIWEYEGDRENLNFPVEKPSFRDKIEVDPSEGSRS